MHKHGMTLLKRERLEKSGYFQKRKKSTELFLSVFRSPILICYLFLTQPELTELAHPALK